MSIDRAHLRKLSDAATPGPWESEWDIGEGTLEVLAGTARTGPDGDRPGTYNTTDLVLERDDVWEEDDGEQHAANAEFIADSREAIPALLDALDKAEYEREQHFTSAVTATNTCMDALARAEQAEARLQAVRAVLDKPIRLRDWDEAFVPASHILRALDGDAGA